MEQIKFQVVENYALTPKVCDEGRLIGGLKGEKMKNLIEPIRGLLNNGEKEKADALKQKLPALLISGTFKGGRRAENLIAYSHILCLDLDKIEREKVTELKNTVSNCLYTFVAFISPSGCGMKILVKVSTGSNYHRDAYKQVVAYYSKLLGLKFDEKTCDINRLTYMSYDPEPYHYPDSDVFQVETPIREVYKNVDNGLPLVDQYKTLYKNVFEFTARKEKYEPANKNNFIHLLASNANRYGLPKDALISLLDWCDKPKDEILATVNSAYKRVEQFSTWTLPANKISQKLSHPVVDLALETIVKGGIKYFEDLANNAQDSCFLPPAKEEVELENGNHVTKMETANEFESSINSAASVDKQVDIENSITDSQDLSMAPALPSEVYNCLPHFLKGITNHFQNSRERDLVLMSALSVLSSVFPNVHGIYDRAKIGLNLFLFVVAPPSSGKGQMKWAWALGNKIHKYLHEKYETEYSQFLKSDRESKEPMEKMFFIPANASSSAIYGQMERNFNFGVIFDNEGDTLSQMLKTDWSNFSPLLRKAFQNEPFSQLRKAKADCRTIDKAYLSITLSGTPNQVPKLIDTIEDGLFSRFMFLTFDHELKWKNKFSTGSDCLEGEFDKASEQVLKMWQAGEKSEGTIITVTPSHQDVINNYFSRRLTELYNLHGELIVPNVYRTCLMWYRIAMILTVIRAYENNDKLPDQLAIGDSDCRAAFLIVDTLLEHLQVIFEDVMQKKVPEQKGKKETLKDNLPERFKRGEFLKIASGMGIKQSTANKYLKDLEKERMIRKIPSDHGWYQKAA